MGGLIAEKGNPQKAMEYFTKAAKLDPSNPAVHYNLSIAYEMMGKPVEAREEKGKFDELDAASKREANKARQSSVNLPPYDPRNVGTPSK
jgi:Flp pilus assembly protein TadD